MPAGTLKRRQLTRGQEKHFFDQAIGADGTLASQGASAVMSFCMMRFGVNLDFEAVSKFLVRHAALVRRANKKRRRTRPR